MVLEDPYSQAGEILSRIGDALGGVGCGLSGVAQTRVYATDVSRWEVRPATTVVGVDGLVSAEMLEEVGAVAVAPRVDRGG